MPIPIDFLGTLWRPFRQRTYIRCHREWVSSCPFVAKDPPWHTTLFSSLFSYLYSTTLSTCPLWAAASPPSPLSRYGLLGQLPRVEGIMFYWATGILEDFHRINRKFGWVSKKSSRLEKPMSCIKWEKIFMFKFAQNSKMNLPRAFNPWDILTQLSPPIFPLLPYKDKKINGPSCPWFPPLIPS